MLPRTQITLDARELVEIIDALKDYHAKVSKRRPGMQWGSPAELAAASAEITLLRQRFIEARREMTKAARVAGAPAAGAPAAPAAPVVVMPRKDPNPDYCARCGRDLTEHLDDGRCPARYSFFVALATVDPAKAKELATEPKETRHGDDD